MSVSHLIPATPLPCCSPCLLQGQLLDAEATLGYEQVPRGPTTNFVGDRMSQVRPAKLKLYAELGRGIAIAMITFPLAGWNGCRA